MYKTREDWLLAAYQALAPRFAPHGTLPQRIHVICSWPVSHSKVAVGECYPEEWTDNKSRYITISPALGKNPIEVLATLLHEMIHALGIMNHGKPFKKVALALGLEGKMRSTVAGEVLKKDLEKVAESLGIYPHQVLHRLKKDKVSNPTGPITLVSPQDPTYTIYIARKKYSELGAPLCPFSKKPMIPKDGEQPEEED